MDRRIGTLKGKFHPLAHKPRMRRLDVVEKAIEIREQALSESTVTTEDSLQCGPTPHMMLAQRIRVQDHGALARVFPALLQAGQE